MSSNREVLLGACSRSVKAQAALLSLLTTSSDIKIAVPCSELSKTSCSSSKVVVAVKGTSGSQLLLDCGSFWKGGE